MIARKATQIPPYPSQSTSRKVNGALEDSLNDWIGDYQRLAVAGVRSEAIAQNIALHLTRFQ